MKFGVILFLIVFITIQWNGQCFAQESKSPSRIIAEMERALSLASNEPRAQFRLYSETCKTLVDRGNYKLADSLFSITDQYISFEDDSDIIMKYKAVKAYMFKLNLSFAESLSEYLDIRKYYLSIGDNDQICLVNAQLGEFYRAQGNGELSIKFLYEAQSYLKLYNIKPSTKAFLYSRLASYHGQFKRDEDSVIYYSTRALDTALVAGNKYITALSQNELGFYYMNNYPEDTARSLTYYRDAIKNFKAEDRHRDCLSVTQNMARNYMYFGNYDKAIELLNNAIPDAIENGWSDYLGDAYQIIALSHNALGNKDKVVEYVYLSQETMTNKLNAQHATEVGKLTANYEKGLAESALTEAKAEAQIKGDALRYIIIFSLALLVAIIVIARLFVNVRKNNRQLKQQQQTIKEKNKKLSKTVEEKEFLYKELNHRVKNNLMVLSGLIYLQKESDEDATDERTELYDSLRNRIQTMALVHQKLYGNEETIEINFEDYLKELALLIFKSFSSIHVEKIPLRISCDNLKLSMGLAIPLALMFNELMTNTIKHGTPSSIKKGIEINSKNDDLTTIIKYRDFGNGVSESFDIEKSNTMGMKVIKLMAIQLKGKLLIPKDQSGFCLEISIPESK